MKASPVAFALIKHFEDCRLKAYPDPASDLAIAIRRALPTTGLSGAPWTIGWGHTGPDVVPGLVWSQETADAMLARRVGEFEADVNRLIGFRTVRQCQFDAAIDFAYNVGSDIDADNIAEGLGDSTFLVKWLAGDELGAAAEILKWDRAAGRRMWGLARRRVADRAVFLGASAEAAISAGEQLPRF